jgi:hypothetical protein
MLTPDRLRSIVFGLLCLLAPVALAAPAQAVKAGRDASRAQRWTRSPAKVVVATASTRCTRVCVHMLDIVYRYEALGREHTGTRVWFGDPSLPTKVAAEQMVAEFAPGKAIEVFVDPEDPDEAALFVGRPGPRTWVTAAAPVAAYAAAWLGYLAAVFLIRWIGPRSSGSVARPS